VITTKYNLKKLWNVSSSLGPVCNEFCSFWYALQWRRLWYILLLHCWHGWNSIMTSVVFFSSLTMLKSVSSKSYRSK
jgi:phosphatidylinositol kinase/protein kinase (PI-3  family)